jgi:hypothetical protein
MVNYNRLPVWVFASSYVKEPTNGKCTDKR